METTTQPTTNDTTVSTVGMVTNPYLITTSVNLASIPQDKINCDLDQLTKAEEKSNYKANIAKGVENPQMYRAMSALRLNNPFKGV